MPESNENQFESDAVSALTQAIERIRMRLHEATVSAPPQIYQAIEELKDRSQKKLEVTEQKLSHLAHELGESEEDLLAWLKLDIRSLERQLLQSLLNTTDKSRVELQRWLTKSEKKDS